jgi:signal transduction histidine kinase
MTTSTTATMTTLTTGPMMNERRRRLGFRGRVLGLCAILLVGAGALGLLVQRSVLLQRLENEVRESLEEERREMELLATGSNPATGEPFDGDVKAIFDTFLSRNEIGEGEVYLTFVGDGAYKSTPAPDGVRLDLDTVLVERWTSLSVGERGSIGTPAGPVDYIATPLQNEGRTAGVFVVANFVQNERDEIEDAITVEALVSFSVLVVALGAAWILAGRLLAPIRRLTETARSISDTDLSQRISVDTDDEIAELADTFNDMLDRLDAAFATQRAFIDDAGHELRTPITVIRGQLELMGDDPNERDETIALVTDELDRMARIVNDLLLLAKAEQHDFVVLEPVELSDFTTDLLMKSSVLGDRDWRLDACAEGHVSADAARLTQAMLNLARNAVEHTHNGDEIGIGSQLDDGSVRLWVRDTGPGGPADEPARVFERFRRGRNRARSSDGAGLGLAIVRAVADAHGAQATIDSTPPDGATFSIVLPLDTNATHHHQVAVTTTAADTGSNERIRIP